MELERPVKPYRAPAGAPAPDLFAWEQGTSCVASPIGKSIPGFISSFQVAASADLILMLF